MSKTARHAAALRVFLAGKLGVASRHLPPKRQAPLECTIHRPEIPSRSVKVGKRWIVAALRHRKFFSLAELSQAIRELLAKLTSDRFASAQVAAPACSPRRSVPALGERAWMA